MKYIYKIASVSVLALFFAVSCDRSESSAESPALVSLSLRTDCATVVTRSTESGEDKYNENLISSIHWYFFDADDEWIMDGEQSVNKTSSADISLSGLTVAKFNAIFDGRSSVKAFVVANMSSAPEGSSGMTLDDVKSTTLVLSGYKEQGNFVMVGEGTVSKTSGATIKSAGTATPISLKRIASKFRISLEINNLYVNPKDASEWVPETAALSMVFKNLEPKGSLGCEAVQSTNLSSQTFTVSGSTLKKTSAGSSSAPQVWELSGPLYSYPRSWNHEDIDFPYLYITLPWTKSTGSGTLTETTYYRVMFPTETFESNSLYDLTVSLDGLGSLVPEASVSVEDMSLIVNGEWKDAIEAVDKHDTEADMAVPHVLSVDSNVYTVYNQDTLRIHFISSHACAIEQVTTPGTYGLPANSDSGAGASASVSVDNDGDVITFIHSLTNMPSSGSSYDFKEFVQSYKLYHTTDASVYEFVTIYQKPAICIEEETSDDDYIFIHGAALTSSGNNDHSYRILKTSSGVSAYGIQRVTTGVLPTEGALANYVIGDPRDRAHAVTDFSTLLSQSEIYYTSGSTKRYYTGENNTTTTHTATSTFTFSEVSTSPGVDMDGNTKHNVSIYYPTRTDAQSANIIAPEFIIASGYPGINSHYMNNAVATLRCAAYQERGYPAGRWRLPTKAEMAYIARLQYDEKILKIFNSTSGYVAADKNYNVSGTTLSTTFSSQYSYMSTYSSVRCVYDSWYWDQVDKEHGWDATRSSRMTTFTYGDLAIE